MFIRRRRIRIEIEQTTLRLESHHPVEPAPAPPVASLPLAHALPSPMTPPSTPTSIKGELL